MVIAASYHKQLENAAFHHQQTSIINTSRCNRGVELMMATGRSVVVAVVVLSVAVVVAGGGGAIFVVVICQW